MFTLYMSITPTFFKTKTLFINIHSFKLTLLVKITTFRAVACGGRGGGGLLGFQEFSEFWKIPRENGHQANKFV